jgi:hypothetical protein
MIHQGVDECAGQIPARGMCNHPGGLVDNYDILVLIQDVERDVFTGDIDRNDTRHITLNNVAWLHHPSGTALFPAIYRNTA